MRRTKGEDLHFEFGTANYGNVTTVCLCIALRCGWHREFMLDDE